jgi:hypothetical protein
VTIQAGSNKPAGESIANQQSQQGATMFIRRITHKCSALAALAAVVALSAVTASAASAATNGQQVAFNLGINGCGAYGPATNVTISGYNQYGTPARWHSGNYSFPNGGYVRGWWWRGVVTVSWRDAATNMYYHQTAFVPQWDDKNFQIQNDIVVVDCRGSLGKVSTRVTQYASAGGVWACGGWRDGAGLTETVYYSGYDEYKTANQFTYGIAGNGTTPAIVTWKAVAPNC